MGSREATSLRRVYEETRCGFCLGVFGGSTVDFMRGLYKYRSIKGGFKGARMNGPIFAAYGLAVSSSFFTVEYTLETLRKKDDIYNQMIAGVASTAVSTLHLGLFAAAGTAVLMGPVTGFVLGGKIK